MTRESITSPKAAAVGPYSHGILAGGFAFLSGQTPLDPATGKLLEGDIAAQTRRTLANLGAVLEAAGLGFDDVVECNVFLVDMADFAAMNAVYAEVFGDHRPARSTVAVSGLPAGALVEIEVWAFLGA